MTAYNDQEERINAIIGDEQDQDFEATVERFYQHLGKSLQLPCDVKGIEDFKWEAFYIFGPGDEKEYQKLRKNQPSCEDAFELLAIEKDRFSEWMMFIDEDLAARVRRKSDAKEFYLGLAEIEAVEQSSINYQLLDDYSVWFVNNR